MPKIGQISGDVQVTGIYYKLFAKTHSNKKLNSKPVEAGGLDFRCTTLLFISNVAPLTSQAPSGWT